jgi:di/tricarboxylate transporter
MALILAASASFITPIGYQTNMMVFGPGGYRFTDFIRIGAPLSFTLWITATILIPIIWPF